MPVPRTPDEVALPAPDDAPPNLGALAREFIDASRERLRAAHVAGASGAEIVEGHTHAMDRLIVFLWEAAAARFRKRNARVGQRSATFAQGGYGRRELNPASDIDLLFLHSWKVGPFFESVTETILYALWDTGLRVGHAVRNLRDCVRLAATDFKVRTALVDARFLHGDERLRVDFDKTVVPEMLRRNAERFLSEKVAESRERHRQYGDSIYLQQPHVKEGEGGLRDLHTAWWLAAVKFKVRSLAELVQKGIVTARDYRDLLASRDFLWRVRNSLHYLTGGPQDQLSFERQEAVAAMLGYRDDERRADEQLMRDYYLHAATIHRFASEVIARCAEKQAPYRRFGRPLGRLIRPGVLILHNGEIAIEDPDLLDREPDDLVQVFRDAQRHGAPLGLRAKALLREKAARVESYEASPAVVKTFLAILRGPERIHDTLAVMHDLGVLGKLVPEFEQLRCMVIRDLYHIYTVDEHTLRAIHELERLLAGELRETSPLLTQVIHEVEHRELLFLALLLHDIGKGHGQGHSERGAALAVEVTRRFGLGQDATREVELLVEHHLLMSHIAQHRDLEDERLIINFAKTLESVEILKKLYVMTFADMRGVAPGVWNNWRDHLLSELYLRTLEVFEKGEFVEEEREVRIRRIRGSLRAALAGRGELTPALEGEMERLPPYYYLSASDETLLRHVTLLGQLRRGDAEVVTTVHHHPEREFSEVTVCTRDRPGLFAQLTGALTAHSMNILSARIVTTLDGVALDVFRIAHGGRAERVLDSRRWEQVRETLEGVLTGKLSAEALVREVDRPSLLTRKRLPSVRTKVRVDNDGSVEYTLVDVETVDRIGLLFAITHTLHRLGCVIHMAKISTVLDHASDVFYVTDLERRKITGSARIEEIREALRNRLESGAGKEDALGQAAG